MVNEILQYEYTTSGAEAESLIIKLTVPRTEKWLVQEVSGKIDADHKVYVFLTERKRVTLLGTAGNTIDFPRLMNWDMQGGIELDVKGIATGAGTSVVQLVVDKQEIGL